MRKKNHYHWTLVSHNCKKLGSNNNSSNNLREFKLQPNLSHVARLITIGTIAPRTSCAAGPTAWGKAKRPSCMQDTFARATHSAKRARDDRVSCIQTSITPVAPRLMHKTSPLQGRVRPHRSPGYATVGSELTKTDNEPPFRVFKFLTPKFFCRIFPFSRGAYAPPAPSAIMQFTQCSKSVWEESI